MLASIGAWLLSKLMGFASSKIVEKGLEIFNKTQDQALNGKDIDAEVAKEATKAYVEQSRVDADLAKSKLAFPAYWFLVALFVVPLAAWWIAVVSDSIFNFPWSIADLPTAEMRAWAGDMIKFLFYTGTAVIGVKALMK